MNNVPHDPSSPRLITALEGNMSAFIPVFGKLGQAYLNDPPGVNRSTTDIPSALFNSIMDARLAPEQVDATIQFIVSDAKSRNVPVLWWIGPSTQPADLGQHLEEHGFVLDEASPAMAVDLARVNESLPMPTGFSIQCARDDAAWRRWGITMALGFGSASPKEHMVNGWCSLLRQADPETVRAYTGWLDDQPVATSLLFLAAGVAGLYAVATIPDARRKGIGSWMTLYPLLQARSEGYRTGVLFASEMGFGVYRALGFREFCRIDSYLWQPGKANAS